MYIIAQHAAEDHWHRHYDADPNATGLHFVHSVSKLPEAQHVKPVYNLDEFDKAVEDCDQLNKRYPNKGYAVVRVL